MGKITITAQQKANNPPAVNAGVDQNITLPTSSVSLLAVASDSDGVIVSTQWIKLSGGNAVITSPNSLGTTVSGLQLGSYVFQVTVYDNMGMSAIDTVAITVANYATMPFIWIGNPASKTCQQGISDNTGYSQYATLLKISDDGNAYPLDINNVRTSISGLSQHSKANDPSDPNYIPPFLDLASCPVSSPSAGEFKSILPMGDYSRTIVSTQTGGGMPVDHTLEIGTNNPTITGLAGVMDKTIMDMGNGRIYNCITAGNHEIVIQGSGILHLDMPANLSTEYICMISFFIKINDEIINMAFRNTDSTYGTGLEYHYLQAMGGPIGSEGDSQPVNFSFDFQETRNLLVGDHISIYTEVRLSSTPTQQGATLTFSDTTVLVNLTHL